MNGFLELLIQDPLYPLCFIKSKVICAFLKLKQNVSFGAGLSLIDAPLIDIRYNFSLIIGRNVTLNSRNKGYHLNMFGPVKLFADGSNAKIITGDRTRIHGACIHASDSIHIGKNCLIAANSHIIDNHGHSLSFSDVEQRILTCGIPQPVMIGDNVWIGANCVIMPGVTIGNGAVIGANSVVTKDIPPMCVAAGNPARVVKVLDEKTGEEKIVLRPSNTSSSKSKAAA